MIDIYTCQPGGSKPCNTKMNPTDMIVGTWVYEKTANIKDYQDPITRVNREVGRMIPSAMLRNGNEFRVGYTDIITDKGSFISNLETKKMLTIFDSKNSVNEKSLANIPTNYLSQGQIFYSDLE